MSATILIGGDYCPVYRLEEEIRSNRGHLVWDNLKNLLKNSDYNIINLEAPITNKDCIPISKAGPSLKCSEEAISVLKNIGIDLVTLANNHMMDYGIDGLNNTIQILRNHKIEYIGIGQNLEDTSQYIIKEINGLRIGIINACETEFSIAKKNAPGCRPVDIIAIYNDIQKLKNDADYIILIIHGGHEHYQLPSPRMKQLYNFFIDSGANVVVNHHQHCFSGYEEREGNYIFYGLGNLCFDNKKKRSGIWTEGYLLKLTFDKNHITPEIIPYIQCGEKVSIELLDASSKDDFDMRLLELNKVISNDESLEKNFRLWISENRMRYISNIAPFSSKIFRGLVRFKILPSFMSKRRKNILYDMFFCESHKDIVKEILHEH
jgi:poly-gamma-glutamate synthesis protein (capsule biosynthesis protein)